MTTTINASTSAGLVQTADTSGVLALQTAGTTAVTVDASQNVGIGTSSPTAKLQVAKAGGVVGTNNLVYVDVTSSYGGVTLNSVSGQNSFYEIYQGGTTKVAEYGVDAANSLVNVGGYSTYGLKFLTSATERMRIDSSGNVGIGTSSPVEKLHVAGRIAVSGTNPSIRQTVQNAFLDLCGGTTVGTDPAIQIAGSTTTSDANKIFYNSNTHLFRTTSGGTTYATIDTSGNLLVGTTTSSVGTATGFRVVSDGSSNAARGELGSASSTNSNIGWSMWSTGATAYRFYVGWGGTIYATSTTITSISDQRLKENIRDLDEGLTTVMALQPRKFDWKEGKGANIKNARGFIAQEFEKVLPDMIEEWRDPAPQGEEPYKAINANLIPTLVKAIQEQQALITQLQADVAALKGK